MLKVDKTRKISFVYWCFYREAAVCICPQYVLQPATLFKKILRHMCFPVNFAKFSRKVFPENTSERLLLFIANIELIPLLPQQKKMVFLLTCKHFFSDKEIIGLKLYITFLRRSIISRIDQPTRAVTWKTRECKTHVAD